MRGAAHGSRFDPHENKSTVNCHATASRFSWGAVANYAKVPCPKKPRLHVPAICTGFRSIMSQTCRDIKASCRLCASRNGPEGERECVRLFSCVFGYNDCDRARSVNFGFMIYDWFKMDTKVQVSYSVAFGHKIGTRRFQSWGAKLLYGTKEFPRRPCHSRQPFCIEFRHMEVRSMIKRKSLTSPNSEVRPFFNVEAGSGLKSSSCSNRSAREDAL